MIQLMLIVPILAVQELCRTICKFSGFVAYARNCLFADKSRVSTPSRVYQVYSGVARPNFCAVERVSTVLCETGLLIPNLFTRGPSQYPCSVPALASASGRC